MRVRVFLPCRLALLLVALYNERLISAVFCPAGSVLAGAAAWAVHYLRLAATLLVPFPLLLDASTGALLPMGEGYGGGGGWGSHAHWAAMPPPTHPPTLGCAGASEAPGASCLKVQSFLLLALGVILPTAVLTGLEWQLRREFVRVEGVAPRSDVLGWAGSMAELVDGSGVRWRRAWRRLVPAARDKRADDAEDRLRVHVRTHARLLLQSIESAAAESEWQGPDARGGVGARGRLGVALAMCAAWHAVDTLQR